MYKGLRTLTVNEVVTATLYALLCLLLDMAGRQDPRAASRQALTHGRPRDSTPLALPHGGTRR